MDINCLYLKACQEDKAAATQLFHSLSESFWILARHKGLDRHESEDVVQAALAKIAKSYREIEIKSSFAAWAQTVMKNQTIEYIRDKITYRRKLAEVSEAQAALRPSSTDLDLKRRLKRCLVQISRVNPRYARVISLHSQGYTTEEVCARLKVTTNNLYTILSRSRAALRACLEEENLADE
ncbi:MAG: RNA polymerase sigma factor [candidate division Zixibacteria bacterium]|nr:RNA polymerase sigma factor [candidate division Zixibacteria bacterium]